ncbi:MAG TPA: penicillin-binding protein activator, partial [Gammaproteobacteria bacterium]|nr:penicillin-binding protein activator [Gammaproteobacteria bacterium]
FMAAFPQQARLIRPQLEFHYAGDLPVYATSHTYSGTPDQRADHDLDGVMFCDMPWILSDDPKTARLKATIRRLWPEQAQQFIRFYALGYDAYNIIPQLDQLKRFPYDEYNGETGVLTVDQDNKVHRRLLWARFVNGAPKLTDAIMPVQH